MLFERREFPPVDPSPFVARWNARQRVRHQYTPSWREATQIPPLSAGRRTPAITSSDHGSNAAAMMVESHGAMVDATYSSVQLPPSHRRLRWEKKCHQLALSTYTDKITGAPSPQQRAALKDLFESSAAAKRPESSYTALRRRINGHQVSV